MATLGTTALQVLYQDYLTTELTYVKDVADALGLLPAESTVKLQTVLYPCLVHSASFQSAKVLMRLTPEQAITVQIGSKVVTLTLVLLDSRKAKKELYQFNGSFQVVQKHLAGDNEIVFLASITFSHRPHEVFLQAHGSSLNLKKEAQARQQDRIALTPETMGILGLSSLNTTVVIDKIERKCLMREVSYGGSRVVLTGAGQFLSEKPFELVFPHTSHGNILIPGMVSRAENMESHRGLAQLALTFTPGKVPVAYLSTLQKGFKQGLGAAKPPRPAPVSDKLHLFSHIDPKTLRPVRGPRH